MLLSALLAVSHGVTSFLPYDFPLAFALTPACGAHAAPVLALCGKHMGHCCAPRHTGSKSAYHKCNSYRCTLASDK